MYSIIAKSVCSFDIVSELYSILSPHTRNLITHTVWIKIIYTLTQVRLCRLFFYTISARAVYKEKKDTS